MVRTKPTKSKVQTEPNQKSIRRCLVWFQTESDQSKPIYFGLVLGLSFQEPINRTDDNPTHYFTKNYALYPTVFARSQLKRQKYPCMS